MRIYDNIFVFGISRWNQRRWWIITLFKLSSNNVRKSTHVPSQISIFCAMTIKSKKIQKNCENIVNWASSENKIRPRFTRLAYNLIKCDHNVIIISWNLLECGLGRGSCEIGRIFCVLFFSMIRCKHFMWRVTNDYNIKDQVLKQTESIPRWNDRGITKFYCWFK